MELKDIMTPNLESIGIGSTLTAAAHMMAKHDVGFLPVHEEDQIVGVITDRDIVVRGVAEMRNPTTTQISDAMTQGMHSLPSDADVDEAAQLMQDKQIRRLVLQDADGEFFGVVSLGDIAQHIDDHKVAGKSLEKICEPAQDETSTVECET